MKTTFHLSLPCLDVEETRNFYGGIEGVRFGRSSTNWLDVDLYGHQLTFNASGRFSFEYGGPHLASRNLHHKDLYIQNLLVEKPIEPPFSQIETLRIS